MLHLPNLLSPISHSPILQSPPTNKLCPQLILNHLPPGYQPCLLPLSHTLPSEKTTILPYKYQRYIILLATRKHQLYSRLKILEFFKTNCHIFLVFRKHQLHPRLHILQFLNITFQCIETAIPQPLRTTHPRG